MQNTPRARRQWSARRRGSSSGHREYRRIARRRPASARLATSGLRAERRVLWIRKSRLTTSERSETEIAPSASTARYGLRSPSRHRRETCRTRPWQHERRSEAASHFTLAGEDGFNRELSYLLILLS